MPFKSLREYVDFLDDEGQLKVVEGADWDREIGGLNQIAVRKRPFPALLFDDIEGYEPGYRVLSNAMTTPFQYSAAAGLDPMEEKIDVVMAQRERSNLQNMTFHPPETVESGPVLENVKSEGIDVLDFPAPRWNDKDGGRYIGTGDVIITRNAETGEINTGTYRVQVHGPETITAYISPGKDGKINVDSYLDREEPSPIVVCAGPPLDVFCGANEYTPSHLRELDYAGGLRGEPIEVIEGETTGLPIPAHSELVFEGHIYPDAEPVQEGPFGEWTGYYAGGSHREGYHSLLPISVERVYHRDDPIIFGKPPIRPPAASYSEIRNAARLWNELDEAGIPGIVKVNSMPFGPGWFEVISIKQQYAGHSSQVAQHAASGPAGGYHGRFTVVVDEEIDPYNQEQVLWAICSRCDPDTDIQILRNCWSTPLDPLIHPDRKRDGDFSNSRALIDATRPYHWRDEFPEVTDVSEEYRGELLEKWGDLFAE